MTERRTLKTVAGSGGQHWGIYDLALDPTRSTMADAAKIAPRAEAAKVDALFLADLLQFGNQGAIGAQEPLIFMAALSQLTTHTGLITTVSSTFNDPYTLARQFGTLDHVSNGRAAWNVVTSAFGEENYGYAEIPSPEQRYARAEEVLEVTHALWNSWEPGALRATEGAARLDAGKVHRIDHHGEHFDVAGPLNIPPLPQGRPVIFQAGQSEGGVRLGARFAEVVFTSLPTIEVAQEFTGRIRSLAASFGRRERPLIFSSLHATYGATEEEALRLARERTESIDLDAGRARLESMLGDADLSGVGLDETLPESLLPEITGISRRRGRVEIFAAWARQGRTLRDLIVAAQDTGHWAETGTPEQIADAIEERYRLGVLDVVSVGDLGEDRTHDFVANGLLPELRRRGIVGSDYLGATLRDNLELPLVR
ncbi:NtaA/DmoA family FMN-dependent monooxygenase [Nocardioides sp. NPDC126508]